MVRFATDNYQGEEYTILLAADNSSTWRPGPVMVG
jgi:hypothetical protein